MSEQADREAGPETGGELVEAPPEDLAHPGGIGAFEESSNEDDFERQVSAALWDDLPTDFELVKEETKASQRCRNCLASFRAGYVKSLVSCPLIILLLYSGLLVGLIVGLWRPVVVDVDFESFRRKDVDSARYHDCYMAALRSLPF